MLDNDIIGNTRGGNGVHDDTRVRVFSEGIPSNETPMQLQARQSIGGENDGATKLVRIPGEIAHSPSSFFNQQGARGGVPLLQAEFPEAVEAAGRNASQVQRGGETGIGVEVLPPGHGYQIVGTSRLGCAVVKQSRRAPGGAS